jgi:hypothetical protein
MQSVLRPGVLIGAGLALVLTLNYVAEGGVASLEQRSNTFWGSLGIQGQEAEFYESLPEMALASDVVVLGRVESVSEGRVFVMEAPPDVPVEDVTFRYVSMSIAVSRTLRHLPGPPEKIAIEMMLPTATTLGDLKGSIPEEETLFFLRSKGLDLERREKPDRVVSQEMPFYRLVSSQGLLRNIGGQTHPNVGAEDQFLLDLVHDQFDKTLDTVVAALD